MFGHRAKEKNNVKHLFSFLINSTGKPARKKGNKSERSLDSSIFATVIPTDALSTNTPRSGKGSDVVTRTIRTKESEVLVPAPDDMNNVIFYLDEVASMDEPSSDPVQHSRKDGSNWLTVQLANIGDYLLNVYQRKGDTIKNLMRYKIRRMDIEASEEEKMPNSDALFKARGTAFILFFLSGLYFINVFV